MKRMGGLSGGKLPAAVLSCCACLLILLSVILGSVAFIIPDWYSTTKLPLTSNLTVPGLGGNFSASVPSIQYSLSPAFRCINDECFTLADNLVGPLLCDDFEAASLAIIGLGSAGMLFGALGGCCMVASALVHFACSVVGGCVLFLGFLMMLISTLLFPFAITGATFAQKTCGIASIGGELCPACELGVGWILLLIATLLLLLASLISCCLCCAAWRGRRRKSTRIPASPAYQQPQPLPPSPTLPVPTNNCCPPAPISPCGPPVPPPCGPPPCMPPAPGSPGAPFPSIGGPVYVGSVVY